MTIEDQKSELVTHMKVTISEAAGNITSGDARSCEVCGIEEFLVGPGSAAIRHDKYTVGCDGPRCDGDFRLGVMEASFDCGYVSFGRTVACQDSCPHCGRSVHPDLWGEKEPGESETGEFLVESLKRTRMSRHHTSYEDGTTIDVCSECHARIHNTDGFHDELEPDMDRAAAEEQGLVG